ncbi:MAG: hypothetical protein ABI353_04540 [Isosphaeraceae bacterium]
MRKLQETLKDENATKKLIKETNLSREELEQFAEKFQKPAQGAVGKPRELEAKPGKDKTLAPNRKAADALAGSTVSKRTDRASGSLPQDQIRGNAQGGSSAPPPEIGLSRFRAYQSSIAGSKAPSPKPAPGKP